jgi:hypothetical protein
MSNISNYRATELMVNSSTKCNTDERVKGSLRVSRYHDRVQRQVKDDKCASC